MNDYIRRIVLKHIPIIHVEDTIVRSFSKHRVHLSHQTVVEVIFKLDELVEARIAEEITGKQGAVIFDGWTTNSAHFIGMILSYCETINKTIIQRSTLVAMSPMSHVQSSQDNLKDPIVSWSI